MLLDQKKQDQQKGRLRFNVCLFVCLSVSVCLCLFVRLYFGFWCLVLDNGFDWRFKASPVQ